MLRKNDSFAPYDHMVERSIKKETNYFSDDKGTPSNIRDKEGAANRYQDF